MKLLLIIAAVSAFAFFESDAACEEPFYIGHDLKQGEEFWWSGSSSSPGSDWASALSPCTSWFVNNAPMASVTFKQKDGYCFVVRKLCIKSKGARKCTITFDCPSQPELRDPIKFKTCIKGSCRSTTLTIKCWRKRNFGTFKFSVKKSEICFLDSNVCP